MAVEAVVKMNVRGIVVKETRLVNGNMVVSILTQTEGIISAFVRDSNKSKSSKTSLVQMFAYCDFTLFLGKSGYVIDEVEIIELFWDIKNDISVLTISQYFCELALALSPEKECSEDFLKLFLNSIFYLSKGRKDVEFIKLIFEMHSCALCGYMPNLVCCDECKKYEDENMYFNISSANILCENCADVCDNSFYQIKLTRGMVAALRHIVYSPVEKLFSFSLSDEALDILSDVSEKYIEYYVKPNFKTLEIYKKLR